eukprot:21271-Prymnesium_polylepis.2
MHPPAFARRAERATGGRRRAVDEAARRHAMWRAAVGRHHLPARLPARDGADLRVCARLELGRVVPAARAQKRRVVTNAGEARAREAWCPRACMC